MKSDAKGITEESMTKIIVVEERKRLGINESDVDIQISENEEEI